MDSLRSIAKVRRQDGSFPAAGDLAGDGSKTRSWTRSGYQRPFCGSLRVAVVEAFVRGGTCGAAEPYGPPQTKPLYAGMSAVRWRPTRDLRKATLAFLEIPVATANRKTEGTRQGRRQLRRKRHPFSTVGNFLVRSCGGSE
jgi:hypothetical protein